MTSLSFHDRMDGYVSFVQDDYNQAWLDGRRARRRCAFEVDIAVADLDAFLADPNLEATVTGRIECEELGGPWTVADGSFNLFTKGGGERRLRMRYRLFGRDAEGREITLSGFKDVADSPNFDVWRDTTTLFVRVLSGRVGLDEELEDPVGTAARTVATGILRISPLRFLRLLLSVRVRPLRQGLAARWRFTRLFAGRLWDVYGGAPVAGDQPDFPDPGFGPAHPERWHGHPPGAWHETEELPGLHRRIVGYEAGDGLHLTLHNIRRHPNDGGTPVILMPGTGVRANLFYGAPGKASIVRALLDAGYDVWAENWRGSIDLPPHDYTLDEAAEHDHPRAIDKVLEATGEDSLKVLCHCQGSTSFVITALTRPEVLRKVQCVVSSAVSLHPVTPTWGRRKLTLLVPPLARFSPYVSAQWGARPPTALAWVTARLARLLRRECDDPVCALGNFMYGAGPDVLWRHANLDDDVHAWTSREFGYAPFKFFKQIRKSVLAGHLVPVDGRPAGTYVDAPLAEHMPPWTFIAGANNRLFTAESQERTFQHFDQRQPDKHALEVLTGYGHLDVFYARDAPERAFPLMLRGLARAQEPDHAGTSTPLGG
jgi:pimeloyl-ACP methyl ester carboxylesterase